MESRNNSVNTYTYDMTGIHIANNNNTVYSYLKDYHGNVIGKADSSGRMIQDAYERMDYDAFGNQLNGNVPDPFGYCGEYYDSESGLIYLRNRYYDSRDGRFITEDPVKDGMNWYVYCDNNPVTRIDSTGTTWDYFDSKLPDYAQEYLKKLTDEYNRTPVDATDIDGRKVRDVIHEKAFNYRIQFLSSKYITYAINDFEDFGIDERNFYKANNVDPNMTYDQFLYEHAMLLQENPFKFTRNEWGERKGHLTDHAYDIVVNVVSSGFSDLIKDIKNNPSNWEKVNETKEMAKKARNGISVETEYINKNTGQRIYKHTVTNSKGKIVHDHYRPYGKG